MKEENFLNTKKPSHWRVCGEFWNLRGQHNQGLNKQTNKQTQNMHLSTSLSREVAQILVSTSSEQGLNRETRVVSLV